MAYNPKLGAMSSPFGENPNEGSIMKGDIREMPVEDGKPNFPNKNPNEINGPDDYAKMVNDALGGVCDAHNRAQTKLTEAKVKQPKEVQNVPETAPVAQKEGPKESFDLDTKNKILADLINSGQTVKGVYDDMIVIEVNGQEIFITAN